MEELFKVATLYMAFAVEAIAALVIAFSVIQGTWATVLVILRRPPEPYGKEAVRIQLGRWLAVALEFELAADILRTAVAPTWNQIGQLAAIVVLRTVLNYFLQQEIDKSVHRSPDHPLESRS
jgi:uncharacterized membrane protein